MSRMRFIMVGGFLGAGKTTTVARLANYYLQRGLKVGIVTNDQASDLVDTHTLRAQGFNVGEVAGACFCCDFNELTATVERLAEDEQPDIILAEPVGSCTDLVATVIQPLLHLYAERFEVAPYGVILKPSHGLRILKQQKNAGFSPKAAYIFEKQLEEADFIIINRIDQLQQDEIEELVELVQKKHPGVPILRMSARSGEGFAGLIELLEQQGQFGRRILELDYDIYAEGEAELGWLNSSILFTSKDPIDLDTLLLDIVSRLGNKLSQLNAEAAHLKVIGLWEGHHAVANLIANDVPAELSLSSECKTRQADLIINARVALDPETLQAEVQAAVNAACTEAGGKAEFRQMQCFRPSRPVPTHRYSEPA